MASISSKMIKVKSGKLLLKKPNSRTPSLQKLKKILPKPFIISPDTFATTPDKSPSIQVTVKGTKKQPDKKELEDMKKSHKESKEPWCRINEEPKSAKDDKTPKPSYKVSKSALAVRNEEKIKKIKKEKVITLKTEEKPLVKKKITKKSDRSSSHGVIPKIKQKDVEVKKDEKKIRKKSKEIRMKIEAKKVQVKGIELLTKKTPDKRIKAKGKKKSVKRDSKQEWLDHSFFMHNKNKDASSRDKHHELNIFSSENFSSYEGIGLNHDSTNNQLEPYLKKHASCQINISHRSSIGTNALSNSLQTSESNIIGQPKKLNKKFRLLQMESKKQKPKSMCPNLAATKIQALIRGFLTRTKITNYIKSNEHSNSGILELDFYQENSEENEVKQIIGELQTSPENNSKNVEDIGSSYENYTFQRKNSDKVLKKIYRLEENKGRNGVIEKRISEPDDACFEKENKRVNNQNSLEKHNSEVIFQRLAEKSKNLEENLRKKSGSSNKLSLNHKDFIETSPDSKDFYPPKSTTSQKNGLIKNLENSPDLAEISFKCLESIPVLPDSNMIKNPKPNDMIKKYQETSPKLKNIIDTNHYQNPKSTDLNTRSPVIPIKSDSLKVFPSLFNPKSLEINPQPKKPTEKRQDISPLTKEILKKNHEPSTSRRSSIEKNSEPNSIQFSIADISEPGSNKKDLQDVLKESLQSSYENGDFGQSVQILSPISKGSLLGISEITKRLKQEQKNYELIEKDHKDIENYMYLDSLISKKADIDELRKKDLENIQKLTNKNGSEMEIFQIFQNIINRRYEKINSMFDDNIRVVQEALAQSVLSEESSSILFSENTSNLLEKISKIDEEMASSKILESIRNQRKNNNSPENVGEKIEFMYKPEKNELNVDDEPEKIIDLNCQIGYSNRYFEIDQSEILIEEYIPTNNNSSKIVWIDEVAMPSNIDFTDLIVDAAISDIYDYLFDWILKDIWFAGSDLVIDLSNELIKVILAQEIHNQIEDLRKEFSDGQILIIISKIFEKTQNLISEELHRPLECDPLSVLSMLQESEVGGGFLPEEKYSMLNFEAFSDVLDHSSKNVKIFNAMVFDSVNEVLENMMCKEELPWATKRNKRCKLLSSEEVQRNLEIELLRFCRLKAGPIVYDEYENSTKMTEQALAIGRENGIIKMLAMEITDNETQWYDYEKEEVQSKLDVADMLLEKEIEHIIEILINS
ncbi:hypothetical protein SteCoe_9538 [Stentor coeruleus]|uniref:DUF4378 domain-containing protein n=1 Tax=Stentor coeruleus TaxID=5963 RepID=A0A1R2CHI0_9CILI|nr:hypothetical protein SteCoe_9538 [Stentor coeruleus]